MREEDAVTNHYARVDGLQPGTAYRYELRSDGVAQPTSMTNPGSFTTLTSPPGAHLFDFALLSDVHIGEGCSGTAANAPLIGTSLPPCFMAPGYADQMTSADVAEVAQRGIDLTVANADQTSTAKFEEEQTARQILAGLPGTVLIARGNHDRPGQHTSEKRCGTDDDCFVTVFANGQPGRVYRSADHGGYHFVILDSSDDTGVGDLTDEMQNVWLARDLAAHRRMPTFISFHHPVAEYANTYAAPPVVFGVRPDKGGNDFLATVAANPQVVGVLNSHTHRNFNAYAATIGPRTPFVENGAAKEYPGGYSVVSVYEGGWTRSFWRPASCAFCREWTATTSGEYFGQYPGYTLGSVGTRNFTHVYGCSAETPPSSLPGDDSLTGPVATPPKSCLARPASPVAAGRPAATRYRCVDARRPTSLLTHRGSRVASRIVKLRGDALDHGCSGLAGVQVALAQRVGSRCRFLEARRILGAATSCRRPRYLTARGTRHFSFAAAGRFPPGSYIAWRRAIDRAGNVEAPQRTRDVLRFRLGKKRPTTRR